MTPELKKLIENSARYYQQNPSLITPDIKKILEENKVTTTVAPSPANVTTTVAPSPANVTTTVAPSPANVTNIKTEDDSSSFRDWVYKYITSPLHRGQQLQAEAREAAGKIAIKTAIETAKTPVTLAKLGLYGTGNKKIVDDIEKSDIGKVYTKAIDTITPELTDEEAIVSEMLSYVTAAGAAKKLTKEVIEVILKKFPGNKGRKIAMEMERQLGGMSKAKVANIIANTTKKNTANLAAVAAFTAVDLQSRKNQEQFLDTVVNDLLGNLAPDFTKWVNENLGVADVIKDLKINPEDADDVVALKQAQDSLYTTFGIAVPLVVLAGAAKGGPSIIKWIFEKQKQARKEVQRLREASGPLEKDNVVKKLLGESKKEEALKNSLIYGAAKIPKPSNNKVVTNSVIRKNDDGSVVMGKTIVEKIGVLNTSLGRELTSARSLPKELAVASLKRINSDKEFNLDIKARLKNILKLQKNNKVSDEDFAAYLNENVNNNLPSVFKKEIDTLNSVVQANENKIFKMLGVKNGTVGVRTDGQKFYYTRQYEAVMNPKWYDDVKKGLIKISKRYKGKDDNEFLEMLFNAKQWFRNKGVPENEIESQIKLLLSNVRAQDSTILDNIFEGTQLGSTGARPLKGRKKLDPEIRALLGEVKDPIKKLESTLISQNKILSELQWLSDVNKFVLNNEGVIKLGGLFPPLPTRVVKIKKGKADIPIKDDIKELSKLFDETIKGLGGKANQSNILKNIYVDPYLYKMIDRGLDIYSPKNAGGNAIERFVAGTSAFFQAAETILDPFAYSLNLMGAVNALVGNGHMFSPNNYKRAVTELGTMIQQITKNDPKAIAKLGLLKKLGVIDQDVTGEMIANNVKMYGTNPGNWPQRAARVYSKAMTTAGRAYGQPDMWSKLVAFESELAAARKVYPKNKYVSKDGKKYDEFITEQAAEIVRDTMPTYGVSIPLARRLSRIPIIGNYILFPTEVMRTHKNILLQSSKDVIEGIKTNNKPMIARGMRRLSGTATTLYGVDMAFGINRDKYGINSNHLKAMQLLQPEWGKGSKELFAQGFTRDARAIKNITIESVKKQFPKKDWEKIRKRFNMREDQYDEFISDRLDYRLENFKPVLGTQTVSSMSLDATDYLKSIFNLTKAGLVGDKNMSKQEIDKAFSSAFTAISGPYLSPKRLVAAIVNAYVGVEERTGKRIYDEAVSADWKENLIRFADTIGKGFGGGAQKAIRDEIYRRSAEELLGEGRAMRASGFPVTPQFLSKFALLGSYKRSRNIEKEMAYSVSKDIKAIDELKKLWKKEVGGMEYYTKEPKDVENIINLYKSLTERKFNGMKNLAEKVNIFNNIEFKDIDENGNEEDTTVREAGLLAKNLSQGWLRRIHPTVDLTIFSNMAGEAEGGIFFPNRHAIEEINNVNLKRHLIERGFSETQANTIFERMIEIEQGYANKELLERKE